jgi:hypothetical protein
MCTWLPSGAILHASITKNPEHAEGEQVVCGVRQAVPSSTHACSPSVYLRAGGVKLERAEYLTGRKTGYTCAMRMHASGSDAKVWRCCRYSYGTRSLLLNTAFDCTPRNRWVQQARNNTDGVHVQPINPLCCVACEARSGLDYWCMWQCSECCAAVAMHAM